MVETFDIHSDENLGSMEVSLAISLILFGISVVQAYNYYQNCNDRWLLKSLATVLLILEVFHSYTITHTIYSITVTLAGRQNIKPNSYFLTTGVLLETLITALVQSYFSYRVYQVSGGKLHIPILCWFLSLLQLGGGLALTIQSYFSVPLMYNVIVVTQSFGWLITLTATVGAAVDFFIAASLCYYTKRLSPPDPSSRHRVEALMDKFITWTIQTGLMTSMASVAVVILFQTHKKEEIWFSIYSILAKMYSNSFFCVLNGQHTEKSPERVSKLVFTNDVPFEFTANRVRMSHSTDSVRSLYLPNLSLPENALNNNSSFHRTYGGDTEVLEESRF